MLLHVSDQQLERIDHNCLLKMQAVYSTLKSAERKAADLLLMDPEFFSEATIGEASDKAGCSQATLVRLARKLGYCGYPELKLQLKVKPDEKQSLFYEHISSDDTDDTIVRKLFQACIQTLADTLNVFDIVKYSTAVDALCNAKKVIFCGVGDSSSVALSAYQKFIRAGIDTHYSTDPNVQLIIASHMSKGDVLVAVSHLGRSKSVVDLVKYARSSGITTIAITNYPVSPLSKNTDIILLTAAFAEHIKGEIMTKRLAELCIVECLFVNVMLRKKAELSAGIEKANNALEINIL